MPQADHTDDHWCSLWWYWQNWQKAPVFWTKTTLMKTFPSDWVTRVFCQAEEGAVCVTIVGSRSFVWCHRAVTISHHPDIGHHSACGEHWEPCPCFPHCLVTDGNALKHLSGSRMWTMGVIDPVSALHRFRSGHHQIYTRMWVSAPWSWPAGYRDQTRAPEILLRSVSTNRSRVWAGTDQWGTGVTRPLASEYFWPYRVGDFVLRTNWSPRRKGKFYMRRHVRLNHGSLSWSDARVVRLLPCPVLCAALPYI